MVLVEEEGRILLTHDHDFLRTELSKYGAIILNTHPPLIEEMQKALEKFFNKISPGEIKSKTFLLHHKKHEVMIFS